MTVITTNRELEAFAARAATADFITVDTEFIRDTTYWPRLCLIQIGLEGEAVAVDALAQDLDLGPIWALMADNSVLKVFHSARQDVEIVLQRAGFVPKPLFDTQVAAMVCGFGDAASYETLAGKLAGAKLDKSMRFTDWAHRPLSKRQIDYALSDVTHLRRVYEKLSARIDRAERGAWVAEEMDILLNPGTYLTNPEDAWRRLKPRSTKPRFLAILRELAAWREREAQKRDVPRNRVLKDQSLTEIAAHEPRSIEELGRLRGLHKRQVSGETGAALLQAVAQGLNLPEADCPEPASQPRAGGNGATVELLKVLLKLKCENHGVAQRLVATSDDIQAIASDDDADVPALRGWRLSLFGEDALKLKRGELALTGGGNALRLVPLAGDG